MPPISKPVTKTEYEKKIKELEDKQAELQKQIDELKQIKIEEKRWKPEPYEEYWFISDSGEIYCSVWTNTHQNRWRYSTGNVFKTEQEAVEYKKKIEFQSKFKNYVEERNKELDWENDNQEKWFMYYSITEKEIRTNYALYAKSQGVIYASSREILKDAIKEIGEENVKKYILEVEDGK